jgi:hypothetical protein
LAVTEKSLARQYTAAILFMASYKIVGGDQREYGPVSAEEVRQWIQDGRANGDTLGQAEGGMWKKLSLFPEFADLLGNLPTAVMPGSAPPGMPPAVAVPGIVRPDPKGMVLGPGVALLATAALDLGTTVFGLVAGASGFGGPMAFPGGAPPELEQFLEYLAGPVGMGLNLFGILVNIFVIWAGVRMMSLRNYGVCMAAAILAVVPCTAPCCCLGIAAGIWALVVLSRPEVKQAFS